MKARSLAPTLASATCSWRFRHYAATLDESRHRKCPRVWYFVARRIVIYFYLRRQRAHVDPLVETSCFYEMWPRVPHPVSVNARKPSNVIINAGIINLDIHPLPVLLPRMRFEKTRSINVGINKLVFLSRMLNIYTNVRALICINYFLSRFFTILFVVSTLFIERGSRINADWMREDPPEFFRKV